MKRHENKMGSKLIGRDSLTIQFVGDVSGVAHVSGQQEPLSSVLVSLRILRCKTEFRNCLKKLLDFIEACDCKASMKLSTKTVDNYVDGYMEKIELV